MGAFIDGSIQYEYLDAYYILSCCLGGRSYEPSGGDELLEEAEMLCIKRGSYTDKSRQVLAELPVCCQLFYRLFVSGASLLLERPKFTIVDNFICYFAHLSSNMPF
jgi:hypothetical protein